MRGAARDARLVGSVEEEGRRTALLRQHGKRCLTNRGSVWAPCRRQLRRRHLHDSRTLDGSENGPLYWRVFRYPAGDRPGLQGGCDGKGFGEGATVQDRTVRSDRARLHKCWLRSGGPPEGQDGLQGRQHVLSAAGLQGRFRKVRRGPGCLPRLRANVQRLPSYPGLFLPRQQLRQPVPSRTQG